MRAALVALALTTAASGAHAQLAAAIEPGGRAQLTCSVWRGAALLPVTGPTEADDYSLSPTGAHALFVTHRTGVRVVEMATGQVQAPDCEGMAASARYEIAGWSKDGRYVWITATDEVRRSLFVIDVAAGTASLRSGAIAAYPVAPTSEVTGVYFTDAHPSLQDPPARALWLARASATEPVKISGEFVVRWADDEEREGRLLYQATDTATGASAFLTLDQGEWRVLLAEGSQTALQAELSPDGAHLAFATDSGLFVSSFAGTPAPILEGDPTDRIIRELRWASPTTLLYIASLGAQEVQRSLGVVTLAPGAAPVVRTALTRPGGAHEWRLAPNATETACLVGIRTGDRVGETYIVDLAIDAEPRALQCTQPIWMAEWSEDGSLVAFSAGDDPARASLHVNSADGAWPGINVEVAGPQSIAFSKDNQRLLFTARVAGMEAPSALTLDLAQRQSAVVSGGLPIARAAWAKDGATAWLLMQIRDNRDRPVYWLYRATPGGEPQLIAGDKGIVAWEETAAGELALVGLAQPAFNQLAVRDLASREAWAPGLGLDVRKAAWSPTGNRLMFLAEVFDGRSAAYVVDAPAGEPRLISEQFLVPTDSPPEWSPDGTRLALSPAAAVRTLWLYDAATGQVRRLAEDMQVGPYTWSPTGRHISFNGMRHDGAQRGLQALDVTTGVAALVGPEALVHTWSPDGSRLAMLVRGEGGPFSLKLLSALPAGGPATELAADVLEALWSPDGSALLVTRMADDGLQHLSVVDAGGGDGVLLAEGRPYGTWSPTGDRVAWANYAADGRWGVTVAARDGTGGILFPWPEGLVKTPDDPDNIHVLPGPDGMDLPQPEGPADWLRWSPDGTRLACCALDAETRGWLVLIDLAANQASVISGNLDVLDYAFSPDGSALIVQTREPGERDRYVLHLTNPVAPPLRLTGRVSAELFQWLPDGRLLVTGRQLPLASHVVPLDGTGPQPVANGIAFLPPTRGEESRWVRLMR